MANYRPHLSHFWVNDVHNLEVLKKCDGGGGVLPKKSDGGACRTFLGDEICELVPLRALKPKMTPARVVAVPLTGL